MYTVYMDMVNNKQISIVLEQDEWLSVYIDGQYVDQCISYNEAMLIVEQLSQVH